MTQYVRSCASLMYKVFNESWYLPCDVKYTNGHCSTCLTDLCNDATQFTPIILTVAIPLAVIKINLSICGVP